MYSVFDAHVDTLLRVRSSESFMEGDNSTSLDIPRARKSGVTHLVTAICAEAEADPRKAFETGISRFKEVSEDSSVELLLMLEGCQPLMECSDPEEVMEDLKVASLTWNGRNGLGCGIGCLGGLTAEGRELAVKQAEHDVLLDVSHLSDRAREELLEMGLPTVATHCNCRSLCESPRNLPDEDIRRIADSGGVVGITFVPDFLGSKASLDDIISHLEYLVELAGVECGGFGSDYDGVKVLPEGVEDCTVWPKLFERLDKRGWSGDDIQAVASKNWKRVFNIERRA